jgi:hypothetical protein
MKKPAQLYIYPKWSYASKTAVLFCAVIGLLCGAGGAVMLHYKLKTAGIITWHVGMIAVMGNSYYYIRGMYQKYMDCAWDVYY